MATFILGAGFNVEAAQQAGVDQASYPMVADVARLCFGSAPITDGTSIETLFSEALERGDYGPLERLVAALREADYYIAQELATSKGDNYYREFFESFAGSQFITFNYDSLAETILYRAGRWYPRDGYGFPVIASVYPGYEELLTKKSTNVVLHLHGSASVRSRSFDIRREPGETISYVRELPQTSYSFDPSSITLNFWPFRREVGGDDTEERIIAPIPNKSRGLEESFVRETYRRALEFIRSSDLVIALGYSFNPHDFSSYRPLLNALTECPSRRLLVVAPDANNAASRIGRDFPRLSVHHLRSTFGEWVKSAFPGVDAGQRG